jgi:hypothetical protein
MRKISFGLSILIVLASCTSMQSIDINGVRAQYSVIEEPESGTSATVRMGIMGGCIGTGVRFDCYKLSLLKTITREIAFYMLELESKRFAALDLNAFVLVVDGYAYELFDPDPVLGWAPASSLAPRGYILERLSASVEDSLVEAIAATNSPIELRYTSHGPFILKGELLQEAQQYAQGLQEIDELSDLSIEDDESTPQ